MGSARAARTLLAAATAYGGVVAARRAGGLLDPGRWTRTNHRGAPISLLEGPAVAAGLVASALVLPGRAAAAVAVAAAGGGAFGLLDDLTEDTSRRRKGLRGHLGALREGELTTGAIKILGIGAAGVVAAALAHPRPRTVVGPGGRDGGAAVGWALDVLTSGALVAGTANLVNLLDLRPGRALKAVAVGAVPALAGAGAPAAGAVIGAAAAALPADLDERDMLGDGGANAAGAVLGAAAVLGAPRSLRLALLAGVVGLTVASERVSFTSVIERTPVLRDLDAWGRR